MNTLSECRDSGGSGKYMPWSRDATDMSTGTIHRTRGPAVAKCSSARSEPRFQVRSGRLGPFQEHCSKPPYTMPVARVFEMVIGTSTVVSDSRSATHLTASSAGSLGFPETADNVSTPIFNLGPTNAGPDVFPASIVKAIKAAWRVRPSAGAQSRRASPDAVTSREINVLASSLARKQFTDQGKPL